MKYGLTETQNAYLDYIKGYIKKNNKSPSFREMADHFEVNPGKAHQVVGQLEERGHIVRLSKKARSLTVVED